MVNRNLIKPIPYPNKNRENLNNQLQDLASNTNKKDTVFYEYEIVNKKKENQLARKQARYYGLCLCTRWFFLLAGNAILIAIICSICAILLYVNTPVGFTAKPLTYGQSCISGSTTCDTVAGLTCNTSSVCDCYGNQYWNGTDCVCPSNSTFDGLACITLQGYLQPCTSTANCYNLFTCDNQTNACLCPSTSNSYYTQYWKGSTDDLYGLNGGSCVAKTSWNTACNAYGIESCQEWLGLSCNYVAIGGGTTNWKCSCNTGYYWSTTSSICTLQVTTVGGSCLGAATGETPCSTSITSLYCNTGTYQCQCSNSATYYYNTNTGLCTLKGGYMSTCLFDSWCNTTQGLYCFLSSSGTPCSCPTYPGGYNYCDCPNTQYWDGQKCTSKVAAGTSCIGDYSCTDNTCTFGYC